MAMLNNLLHGQGQRMPALDLRGGRDGTHRQFHGGRQRVPRRSVREAVWDRPKDRGM